MLKSCTKKYTDESDERTFRFTFYCDGCGKPIPTRPVEFTEADAFTKASPPGMAAERQLLEMLWLKEHNASFGRADSLMRETLYHCPCCYEHVCDECVRRAKTPGGIVMPLCKHCCSKKHSHKPFKYITPASKQTI